VNLVLRIGREIAEGLAAAHKHGLIHRDIKPANIWLEAPSGRVKILDFGQARSVRDDVQITHSGTIMGTPAYMSPEQAAGEPVGVATDLFSLGCVLYRLCTSRSPFEGETIMAVLSALSSNTPRPLRELEPGVWTGLDDLVMRLLAKDPANRPASAQAVVDAIRAIERDLMSERQHAELAEDTSHPAVDDAFEPPETRIAQGPDEPRPSARPRVGRRLPRIAAALIGIGAATAVSGRLVFATRHPGKHRIAAQTPMLALAFDGRTVPQIMTTTPAGPQPSLPEAGPEQFDPGEARLEKGSPMLSPESVGPGIVEGPNETRTAVPESKAVNPREQPPALERTEPTGSPAPWTGPTRGQADWGEPIIPDGDCTVDLDRYGNKIKIVVPGTPHVLSAELGRLNAPRILRDVDGDFDASVKVAGIFHPSGRATLKEYTSPYHGAGILLWQDEDNYVRLEIASDLQHGKPRPYVNFEYRKDGALVASRGLKNKDGSSYLRLKRRGDVIHAAFGPDGSGWTSFPPLWVKLNDRLKVGVSAINTATKLLTAELEGFGISERTGPGPGPNVSAKANGINPSP
jgi:regulation of enolase protein 1 (concanavalin A-like superfamily)